MQTKNETLKKQNNDNFRQSTFVFRKPSLLGLRYDRTRIGRMGFLKRLEIKCKKSKIRLGFEDQRFHAPDKNHI